MDAFEEPFWNLDQVTFWAWTRSPEFVRSIANDVLFLDVVPDGADDATPSSNGHGRGVEEELWAASGWDRNKYRDSRLLRKGSTERKRLLQALAVLPQPRVIYAPGFPVSDYLLHLLRSGRLKATGNAPGETFAREISTADWAGLEIRACYNQRTDAFGRAVFKAGAVPSHSVGVGRHIHNPRDGSSRFVVGAVENVRIPREEVLREFPADPAVTLEGILRSAVAQNGGVLTQDKAEKIAREAGVKDSREKIRDTLEIITGTRKTGPKRSRKNSAG